MNRQCSPQNHTAGQLLGRKYLSLGISPPVIPALLYCKTKAQILWVVLCWWDGQIRKERNGTLFFYKLTEWHYHLVDYRDNFKRVYSVGTWKLKKLEPPENIHSGKTPFSPTVLRMVQSLTPTKALQTEIAIEISTLSGDVCRKGLFLLTCGWSDSLPDIYSHRQYP